MQYYFHNKLSVCPVTTHLPIKLVSKLITKINCRKVKLYKVLFVTFEKKTKDSYFGIKSSWKVLINLMKMKK